MSPEDVTRALEDAPPAQGDPGVLALDTLDLDVPENFGSPGAPIVEDKGVIRPGVLRFATVLRIGSQLMIGTPLARDTTKRVVRLVYEVDPRDTPTMRHFLLLPPGVAIPRRGDQGERLDFAYAFVHPETGVPIGVYEIHGVVELPA